jgi:hypothetical protein
MAYADYKGIRREDLIDDLEENKEGFAEAACDVRELVAAVRLGHDEDHEGSFQFCDRVTCRVTWQVLEQSVVNYTLVEGVRVAL